MAFWALVTAARTASDSVPLLNTHSSGASRCSPCGAPPLEDGLYGLTELLLATQPVLERDQQ